jgi:hypothetical protein
MSASARNLRALGAPGAPVQRLLGIDPATVRRHDGRFGVHYDGFDLHAGLSVRARNRKVLERVLRYCARPALAHERIERLSGGRIRLALKTPWSDGTSHLVFEPLEFIGRLAALIPRPHKNLVVYHGVLAARSKLRARVVAYGRPGPVPEPAADPAATPSPRRARHHDREWAALMRRAFDLDILACPRCGGKLKLLACITQPALIRAILRHLALPADAPEPSRARAPPSADLVDDAHDAVDDDPGAVDAFDAVDDDPDAAA